MKCEKCNNAEATVHEVKIKNGQRHETHLCEICAQEAGLATGSVGPGHTPITQLLTQYVTSQTEGAGGAGVSPATGSLATRCMKCSTTYAQFRSSGLLGCPECYAAFEQQLSPLLARAHEGGTHHVGKVPKRPIVSVGGVGGGGGVVSAVPKADVAAPDAGERIKHLRKQLADAVSAEQYEKAAKLRDELARIERGGKSGGGA